MQSVEYFQQQIKTHHAVLGPLVAQQLLDITEDEKQKRDLFIQELHDDTNAEFIFGEIIGHKPRTYFHNRIVGNLSHLISVYLSKNKIGQLSTNKAMIHLTRNNYEPEIVFWNNDVANHFTLDTLLFPQPNFVCEVLTKDTSHIDREIKFEDYAAHEVGEYWIIDADKEIVELYILENKEYTLKQKSGTGNIEATEIKGFKIPVEAIFNDEKNLEALKNLL